MSSLMILLAPSANRVYADAAEELVAAELEIMLGGDRGAIEPIMLAGIAYLQLDSELDDRLHEALGRLSAFFAVYARDHDHLRPIEVSRPDLFDDDLVSIPKYPGKTNEQFTRLLINVTLASMTRRPPGPLTILDPLCGRGTTLSTGLTLGHDVAGVDADLKALEAYAAYLRTYLRRKRLKHTAELHPVRRDGRSIGRRLDAEIRPERAERALSLTAFSGDTRQSAALFGKRRFDAVIADAPYGVVHGSQTDVRGHAGKRDRSAAGLIGEALPVWAGQLKSGGALGLSWNTHGLARERLIELAREAGLDPLDDGAYRRFGHRVDSSIHRDILVAVKPDKSLLRRVAAPMSRSPAPRQLGAGPILLPDPRRLPGMENRRTLILMRHAQTEETRPGSRDTDRRLTAQGEQQARDVGAFLRDQGIVIDTVLCSSAVRARQTLELLDLVDGAPTDISLRYYNAGTDTLIEAIRALPDDCRTAMMIGHAPAVPGLVYELCDQATSDSAAFDSVTSRFPAGTIARLEFDGSWTAIGTSRLMSVRYPNSPNH